MNYVNYLKHTVSTPDTYHRRYDLDWEGVEEPSKIKRVALATLPFLALYRPMASVISLGMGSFRAISHFNLGLIYEQNRDWGRFCKEIGEMALAVFAISATILSFAVGLAIITAIDTGKGALYTAQACWNQEWNKAGEEALQTLASGFYLAFMATGALEVILVSTLIQAVVCLYQARGEIAEKRFLEAAAKIGMAGIRLGQANHYGELIQRRNQLFAMQKYQTLVAQAMKGRAVRHLVHHSLIDLDGKVDEKQVILSNQEGEYDFGAHFHGFGKGLVKGANLAFRKTEKGIECEFKINHAFRDELQENINELSKLSRKEMREVLKLTGSHAQDIRVEKPDTVHSFFFSDDIDIHYTVNVTGLGTVSIGGCDQMPNLYDKVVIQMDGDKTLYDLHELMALTNLDTALCTSSQDDLDRLKIGHLFRTFFPREATPFERNRDFFSLSTDDLKATIIQKAPEMKELFETHLSKMTQAEILPGRVRYNIDGLAEKVHAAGGRALTAAVTGAYQNDTELYERVASMLNVGMISQELRDRYGIDSSGYGGSYFMGGADAVYTQMITENLVKEDPTLSALQYQSKVRMLISLKALETGTYQYYDDDFGTRRYKLDDWWWKNDLYANRPDILELTKELQSTPTSSHRYGKDWNYDGHEVMLKERLDPSLFEGIVVDTQKTRDDLLSYLRTCNLIQTDQLGKETILGYNIDRFIHVGEVALG